MVAPIASAASSFGRAFARRGARKSRASPRRSSTRGASACALPQLGQWPTPAELNRALPTPKLADAAAKLADDSGGSRPGTDWSETQRRVEAAFPTPIDAVDRRGPEALVVPAVPAEARHLESGERDVDANSKGGASVCAGGCAPAEEDRHAAAVRAFLERVQQSRKVGRGDDAGSFGLHHSRHDHAIARQDERWALISGISGKRSIWFNLGSNSVHEVTPYSEVYGRHPREFVFGRNAEMLPAGDRFGFVGLQDPEDDGAESEEDWPEEFQLNHADADLYAEECHEAEATTPLAHEENAEQR